MSQRARWKLQLRHLEAFVFFAAMLLAIVVEGACVYWLGLPRVVHARSGAPPTVLVEWTACTLPQYWLLGAMAVLLYRVAVMLVPPQRWGQVESQRNRRAFLRLWCWTIAVGTVQMAALYLDRLSLGVH
jgi:hypothetical protein